MGGWIPCGTTAEIDRRFTRLLLVLVLVVRKLIVLTGRVPNSRLSMMMHRI